MLFYASADGVVIDGAGMKFAYLPRMLPETPEKPVEQGTKL